MSKKTQLRLTMAMICGLLAVNMSALPAAQAAFVMTDYLNHGSSSAFAGGTVKGRSASGAVMDSQGNFYYSTDQVSSQSYADGCKGSSSAYGGSIMKGSTSNSGVATGIFEYYGANQSSSSLAINYPSAVGLDANEVLFAADSDCGSLLRITDSGTATAYVSIPAWRTLNGNTKPEIRGMGFNTSGDLIVSDASTQKGVWLIPTNDVSGGTSSTGKTPIRIFKSDSATAFMDSGVTVNSPAIVCTPWSVSVATDGTTFIGCTNSGGVRDKVIKLTPYSGNKYEAEILIEYPSENPGPRGMGIDADGRLYVALHYPGTTVRYNPTDSVTAQADSVTVLSGQNLASGIFFDRVGNLYPFDGSKIKKATGVGRPFPPVGLRTTLGNRSVVLNWNTPGVTGIETYTVTATQGLASVGSCESVWPNLTCTVSGLTPGVNYGFSITAKNTTGGESLAAAKVYATVVGSPDAPTIGTATAYDSKTATVTFTAPISNGGSVITGYQATAIPGGETGTVSGAGSGTIYIYGLTTNVAESFTVVAINAIGTSAASGASNTVTPLADTVPPAPVVSGVGVSAPDSKQDMEITNKEALSGPVTGGKIAKISYTSGGYCRITNVQVDQITLPLTSWTQEAASIEILMPAHKAGLATIQLFNGCSPLLSQIAYLYSAVENKAEENAPVKESNIQPLAAMAKVGTVYFATGTYFLNDASKTTLRGIARTISASPATYVLSYGHTDTKKGADNTALSRNRAKAVSSYLSKIILEKKMITGWYASTKPLSQGSSKSDLAKNRRVEIYIK